MRILFAGTNLPVPPNNGQAIRSLSILRALASCGHELEFLAAVNKPVPESLEPLSSYCQNIGLVRSDVPNVSHNSNYLRRVICLLSGTSFSIERFRSRKVREAIQHCLDTETFNLIVADGLYSLVNIPSTAVPIALNCHNIEYMIYQRYAGLERSRAKRIYARIESRLILREEERACNRVSLAMVCSRRDRDFLQQMRDDLPVSVIPNVVDTDFFSGVEQRSGDREKRPVILFLGSMDWFPNRDAVEFFASAVLPLVRAECPQVKFVVAGRNPAAAFVSKFAGDHSIEFTGTVPDIRPFLSAATVVIAPLRIGSGTRIKILEASASGRPTVATKVGAEGLDLIESKEILLADEPAQFSGAILELIRDPTRSRAIGAAAREAVIERYSQAALERALTNAIGRSRPSAKAAISA